MKKIIFATNNDHKTKELSMIFGDNIFLQNLKTIGFNDEIIENGNTFIENSIIKCSTVYQKARSPVLADDSGLCVEILDGRPGILSARYGGDNNNDKDRYNMLLQELNGIKNTTNEPFFASFVCAMVLYINPNRIYVIQEAVTGQITFSPRGSNGFGYDPIFYLPEFDKTMAELIDVEKSKISHRAQAAILMLEIIKKLTF